MDAITVSTWHQRDFETYFQHILKLTLLCRPTSYDRVRVVVNSWGIYKLKMSQIKFKWPLRSLNIFRLHRSNFQSEEWFSTFYSIYVEVTHVQYIFFGTRGTHITWYLKNKNLKSSVFHTNRCVKRCSPFQLLVELIQSQI